MNLNSNKINGNPAHAPVNPPNNPANLLVEPLLQTVSIQQVLPASQNTIIPVNVPSGIFPSNSIFLDEISKKPFTSEKAVGVFKKFEDLDSRYLVYDLANTDAQDLLKCIQYVIDNYPVEVIYDESFLRVIIELLGINDDGKSSKIALLHTDILCSFFEKFHPSMIMDQKKWEKYFKDGFLSCLDYLLNQSDDLVNCIEVFYFCRIKLFLILFGEDQEYCETLFDETYDESKNNNDLVQLFQKSSKSREEFKLYLKKELFGSVTLFYPWSIGCTNAKNYYDFLKEKTKGLPHPFISFHSTGLKSARNVT